MESKTYRMPAEWERHQATWIGWPHNLTDWPGKFAPIPWVYGEIVRRLAEGEDVHIFVNNAAHETKARAVLLKVGVDAGRVRFFRKKTDRGWTRDSGPVFAKERGTDRLHVLGFGFNAWAKYPDWRHDVKNPGFASATLSFPLAAVTHKGKPVVLEGGAIDVNGTGSLITTEECLLHPNVQVRNPGFSRADYEEIFNRYLGVRNVIWLGRGIAGDDTHGHTDDCCRFINRTTILACEERNNDDPNCEILNENLERLKHTRLEDGTKPEIVTLPMPGPLVFNGQRVPASYANFYITNNSILVPTFNDPNDRKALGIIAECAGGRTVIGIHAVDLVWGLGTLHCLTQQQPENG